MLWQKKGKKTLYKHVNKTEYLFNVKNSKGKLQK